MRVFPANIFKALVAWPIHIQYGRQQLPRCGKELTKQIRRFKRSLLKHIMDRFVVRTKRLPRPERESTVTKDNKKQATIESLAVSFMGLF